MFTNTNGFPCTLRFFAWSVSHTLSIEHRLKHSKLAVLRKKLSFKNANNICNKNLDKIMELLVNVVKKGFGTTNNSNTARKISSNPEVSSGISGIDETLVKNSGLILRLISTRKEIWRIICSTAGSAVPSRLNALATSFWANSCPKRGTEAFPRVFCQNVDATATRFWVSISPEKKSSYSKL